MFEVVVFKVRNPEAGLAAAKAVIGDAKAYNDGVIGAETYQSLDDPHLLTQRIEWRSLAHAKDAQAAFPTFPNAPKMMPLITETVMMDHFVTSPAAV